MTASTPPLVDVIAEAIAAHERLISQSLHQECRCGWVGKVLGFDHAAHQARAVLDALTKAGGVEWGVQTRTFIDGDFDRTLTTMNYQPLTKEAATEHADNMNGRHQIARAVSRITGPWEPC